MFDEGQRRPYVSVSLDNELAAKRCARKIREKMQMAHDNPKKWVHNAQGVEYLDD